MRKIISISTFSLGNNYYIIALCDDGTLWRRNSGTENWFRIEYIPQH
jgi:hypothetical protein